MRVLLTGGAGFIGSHVAERLLREQHQVTIIDDLNDFYTPGLKRMNIEQVCRAGPIHFHKVDICQLPTVSNIVAANPPDAVIHLAARAGVRPSLAAPLLYEHVNVQGTISLLETCRRYGVQKFVFASSSSIYGLANRVPFSEDDHHNLPISPYAATKLAGEKICFMYSHLYGIRVVCLRFFTVYGPRQRPDLAIRKFTEMIDRGQMIPVFGDGTSGRDYTFIDDTVDGIMAALSYDTQYDIFNLGNSHPVTLNTLIAMLEEALGQKAQIQSHPDQPGDVPITYADISKAQRLLNYQPRTSFSDGIQKFIEWHRGMKVNHSAFG